MTVLPPDPSSAPPPPAPPAPPELASGNATTALTLGIVGAVSGLGCCCCCLFVLPAGCAPVAWYMGQAELAAIRAGASSPAGQGSAQAGMILGIIGTVLIALYVLAMIGYAVFLGSAVALEAMKHGVPR